MMGFDGNTCQGYNHRYDQRFCVVISDHYKESKVRFHQSLACKTGAIVNKPQRSIDWKFNSSNPYDPKYDKKKVNSILVHVNNNFKEGNLIEFRHESAGSPGCFKYALRHYFNVL
jgi:hypothetical protein